LANEADVPCTSSRSDNTSAWVGQFLIAVARGHEADAQFLLSTLVGPTKVGSQELAICLMASGYGNKNWPTQAEVLSGSRTCARYIASLAIGGPHGKNTTIQRLTHVIECFRIEL